MGRKRKATPKVDSAPQAVVNSENKGKINGEDEIAKAVSAKKQKIERDETVVATQKADENKPEKVESNCESKDDFSSEDIPKAAVDQTKPLKEAPVVVEEIKKDNSSDASDVIDDEPKKQPDVALDNGSKKDSSSDKISDETKVAANPAAEMEQENSSGDKESSEEDEEPPKANQATPVTASKKISSTDNSSDDESGDEEESSDEKLPETPKDTDVEMVEAQESKKCALKTPETPAIQQNQNTGSKILFAGNLSYEVQESDVKEFFKDVGEIVDIRFASDAGGRCKGYGHIEFATAESAKKALDLNGQLLLNRPVKLDLARERGLKTPNTREGAQNLTISVKGIDTSADEDDPKTPAIQQNQNTGSKVLFAGNLSYEVQESDVKEFFKDVGEIADIRFASDAGGRFMGYGHIEFATAESAKKALDLNGQLLFNRPVKLDPARERGAKTPNTREGAQNLTIFVKGFDTSADEDDMRNSLKQHFASCGEVTRVSIPPDRDNNCLKGTAHIDFVDSDGFKKALELDGSDLGGSYLTVQEGKPKGKRGGGGGRSGDRRGGGGGRFGDRRGGGGRFGDRRGGGRFGRGGGDRGSRGRGGRGTRK